MNHSVAVSPVFNFDFNRSPRLKRKVTIIGIVGVPPCYGGFETLIENLLINSSNAIEYTVFCSARIYKTRIHKYRNAILKYINLNPNGMQSIFYDGTRFHISLSSDAVVILGCSGAIFLPLFRLFYRGIIIVNIDGIEWQRNKWSFSVRVLLRFLEALAVRFSNVIVGDNKVIADYVFSTYGKTAKLIEYGGDNIGNETLNANTNYKHFSKRYAITVCRIVPENNIAMILEAFSQIDSFHCVIVGDWDQSNFGRELRDRYSNSTTLSLLDPIYETAHINTLRSHSSLYIHGHSAGGTNPSLVEAMFLGLPIFAYKCAYNYETTEGKCCYFDTANALLALLKRTTENEMKVIGAAMSEIANRRYSWKMISQMYEETILSGKSKPKT